MKKERIHQLYMILASSQEWHLAGDLAFRLHTTTRTINNYVNEINNSSETGDLIISSFRGYRWNPAAQQIKAPETPDQSGSMFSSDERSWYILRRIILERIEYDQLLEDLFISESTIDSDLQKVRDLARRHDVRLRNVRGRLSLNGRRSDIRRLSFLCVMQSYSNRNITVQMVKQGFPDYDCEALYRLLLRTLEKYSMNVNAYVESSFFLLIMLQYWDVMHDTMMEESESVISDIRDHIEYRAADELALLYKERTGAVYNPWEIEYLAAIIISMTELDSEDPSQPFADYADLRDKTIMNLNNASLALGIDLSQDPIVDQMMNYMQKLIIRSKMGFIIKDLTFESIKSSYPVIQDVSSWILIFTAKQYNIQIDRNEVGFLAKYLCSLIKEHRYPFEPTINTTLICPSFGNFPDSLAETLTKRLGDSINLHKIIGSVDIDNNEKKSDELFLSVLPVSGLHHCVNISLYPRAADFRHIYSELHRIKASFYNKQLAELLDQLLCPEIVIKDSSNNNGALILQDICRDLQKAGYIKEGFADDIAERESMDLSIYHANIALPHVYSKNVRRSFIQIALFDRSATWRDTKINMLCVIGIVHGMPIELYEIYDLCIKVFSNQQNTSALLKAYDRKSFIEILKTIEIV